MTTPSRHLPKYRHQKSKNLGVVRINGHDIYLGKYDTPESHEKYRRVLAEWLTTGAIPSPQKVHQGPGVDDGPTVIEIMIPYLDHVDVYYVENGEPTSEATLIRLALRVLKEYFGHTPAASFGPLALKTVQKAFINAGLCRREVNCRQGLIVRFFKWAVEHELVPPRSTTG